MKCDFCSNFMPELDRCKFCHFEYEERYIKGDWDILDLPDDEWEHIQILNRLHSQGIDCVMADIYFGKNMAYLIGCFADTNKIAKVLGLHKDSVYGYNDNGIVLLNLYQEKHIRESENIRN